MNYQAHYDALMERAKHRVLSGYRERHHILPRCMGGKDAPANIVELTAEEHYVAHQLLVKMYPSRVGLVTAASWMSKRCSGSRAYGWLRRRISEARKGKQLSAAHKVKLSIAKIGKTLSLEHRRKLIAANTGRVCSEETKRKIGEKHKGHHRLVGHAVSEDTRAKISLARMGHDVSQETRAKISASKKGHKYGPNSAEHNEKIAAAKRGKKLSKEHVVKMSVARRGVPWSPARRAYLNVVSHGS